MLLNIFEFSRQNSTSESKGVILMIFGAKIQIFQKLLKEPEEMSFLA